MEHRTGLAPLRCRDTATPGKPGIAFAPRTGLVHRVGVQAEPFSSMRRADLVLNPLRSCARRLGSCHQSTHRLSGFLDGHCFQKKQVEDLLFPDFFHARRSPSLRVHGGTAQLVSACEIPAGATCAMLPRLNTATVRSSRKRIVSLCFFHDVHDRSLKAKGRVAIA